MDIKLIFSFDFDAKKLVMHKSACHLILKFALLQLENRFRDRLLISNYAEETPSIKLNLLSLCRNIMKNYSYNSNKIDMLSITKGFLLENS